VSSIEPYKGSDQEHGGKKVSGCFVVAGGNSPELLEFGEEVFDQMSRLVHVFIVGAWILSVGFRWDNDLLACLFERFYDALIGVKGFVGKEGICRDVGQENVRAFKIASLSWREDEIEGIAERIDDGVYLGRQPAF
jgi:hypothetical protein